eukprot:TRINITY_DN26586_c0_g1_i1.p1 TRINITY_DN26586_c0_g1~~TRINITY_DN26586_c0_g1_i1.p1  ORF type:complete len:553 (-),score=116.21 TRINITY_DN26586_c0_g1_i1:135-1793(-)
MVVGRTSRASHRSSQHSHGKLESRGSRSSLPHHVSTGPAAAFASAAAAEEAVAEEALAEEAEAPAGEAAGEAARPEHRPQVESDDWLYVHVERLQGMGTKIGRPTLRIWAATAGADTGKAGSRRAAEWSAKPFQDETAWFSARPLGLSAAEHSGATVHVELCAGAAVLAGASLPVSEAPAFEQRLCLDLEDMGEQPGFRHMRVLPKIAPKVTFRLLRGPRDPAPRTVFLIRHGESRWNQAQRKWNFYAMAREKDHGLTEKGRDQAEALAAKLLRLSAESLSAESAATPMLSPDAIFVSPLSRALQTALISLRRVATAPGNPQELVLMPAARECQSRGGFDTRAESIGAEVPARAREALHSLYREQPSCEPAEALDALKLDLRQVEGCWWHTGAKETEEELELRLQEFFAQLAYAEPRTIVVVSHSHFFRAVFNRFLSKDFCLRQPALAEGLKTMKLACCGVARIDLDPAALLSGPVVSAELLLGTELVRSGGLKGTWRQFKGMFGGRGDSGANNAQAARRSSRLSAMKSLSSGGRASASMRRRSSTKVTATE